MIFKISAIAVAVLLLSAVPGYIMMKRKMLGEKSISDLSKILMFVCQPCLAVYTFMGIEYSPEIMADLGVFALLCFVVMGGMLGLSYLVLRKKCEKPIYRIMTIATTFSNCAFFGIPIIEAIFEERSGELIVYTTVFAIVMNVIGWTLGSAIISRDVKYMSLKKIFLNPAMIGGIVALIIFVLSIPIQKDLASIVTITARMSTPLSMIIMGMRLATIDVRELFSDFRIYLAVAVNQLLMPLVAFGIVFALPISAEVKQTFFIICACPIASVVLNFAEVVGEGQREGAKSFLLGTILSILTLPLMMLLLPYLA